RRSSPTSRNLLPRRWRTVGRSSQRKTTGLARPQRVEESRKYERYAGDCRSSGPEFRGKRRHEVPGGKTSLNAMPGPLATILQAVTVREQRRDAIRAELKTLATPRRAEAPNTSKSRTELVQYLEPA